MTIKKVLKKIGYFIFPLYLCASKTIYEEKLAKYHPKVRNIRFLLH